MEEYIIGDFMESATFTFEKDCTYYWCTNWTEPLILIEDVE